MSQLTRCGYRQSLDQMLTRHPAGQLLLQNLPTDRFARLGRECNVIQHNNWHALLLIAFTYHTAFCLTALELVQHELSRFHCITPVLVYYCTYVICYFIVCLLFFFVQSHLDELSALEDLFVRRAVEVVNMTGYPIVCLTDSALLPFWEYSPSLWFIRKLFQKILQFEVYHSSFFQVILLLKVNKLIRFPGFKGC